MKYKNFLHYFPGRDKNIIKENGSYYNHIVTGLINNKIDTKDKELEDFKNRFIEIIINKLDAGFNEEYFFDIKNILSLTSLNLIKGLKNEFLDLLEKDEKEILDIVNTIDGFYKFTCLDKRIKDGKTYKIIKKDLEYPDIFSYINELYSNILRVSDRAVRELANKKLTEEDINLFLEILNNEEEKNNLLNEYLREFELFKNCDILFFEKLYQFSIENLNNLLVKELRFEIINLNDKKQKEKNNKYQYIKKR